MSELRLGRFAYLCDTLNLSSVLDGYAALTTDASERGHSQVEYLELGFVLSGLPSGTLR